MSTTKIEWCDYTINPVGDLPLLSNVWLGVTVCNQQEADKKIPVLLETPAVKRFVSIEPMLASVNLTRIKYFLSLDDDSYNCLSGNGISYYSYEYPAFTRNGPKLDWVICGGETGPKARPMHPDWVRDLRDQCAAASVPFFFKGWGEWAEIHTLRCNEPGIKGKMWYNFDPDTSVCRVGKRRSGRLLDGIEYSEMPPCPNL